ncbi:dihydrolipoyllysine-residue acetyltransferase [Orrella dioscoreae]|uniref:Acetyltransferase component of pyruvate dehydrogenase complex n=1 Tax=Orrella dioscoreae TaxID=1851544 RepID=A0A1C3JY68_9BURK|nr:dihydrolipoyllysine-residue acetyltransferase [Orrella dioscoreae]SBT24211.1 Dihydrolipoamide acetyltransferase component of pyruvate dehydrogenase complex [Orrella dioscoreae]SOE49965.1 Dihydrolipoamide acetyltransferase component of pyruvate dehydrogenase complex [Orrella dioscoreae]
MSNTVEIKVPDIGDFDSVEVIEVLVSEGDTIQAEQSLITVESDKASMEIPASEGGVVKSIKIKVGDKVAKGSVIVEVEAAAGGKADAAPAKEAKEAPATEDSKASAAPRQETQEAKAEAPAKAASGGVVDVAVPDIGDFDSVEVIEVLVAEGDSIKAEQSLITVESDKASMEIPSSHAGVLTSLKVKVGDKVAKGSIIAQVEAAGDSAPAKEAPKAAKPEAAAAPAKADAGRAEASAPAPAKEAPAQALKADVVDDAKQRLAHASPSVRKFARELGADLSKVQGSGPKGRITQDDVRGYVKKVLAGQGAGAPAAAGGADGAALGLLPWPKVDFTKFGPVEAKPLSRIKKISGANLHRNWVMIPHVTNNDEADITDLEALRVTLNKENEKSGVKVTMLAFLIKAVVAALKKFPEFNASLDGDNLVLKQYYHIGFAADTPNGLVVPVIRDADKKGVAELAQLTSELAKKARDGKLSPSEMQGGCFSISSLGGIGGTHFTPIINAPEVAIMGVSRSYHKPVWNGKEFQPRLTLPLSLSYDHRVIDGASAARFNAYVGALLADFRRIVL